MSPRRIQIFDTTLRDGEQSPGVALRPEEKAEIACQLERLGVDVVEAGFAGASPEGFDGVRAVAAAVDGPTVASFAGTRADDVEAAAEALAGARRSRIHLSLDLGGDPDEVVLEARRAVRHAVTVAHEVQLSCERASGAEPAFVARVCRAAVEAGAGTIGLPDTAGSMLPGQYARFLGDVLRRCPELAAVTVSAHCHNDLGLAVANSLAGVQAGAGQVECTVNGIGERAGNAPLEEIAVALKVRADYFGVDTGLETSALASASRLVAQRTGYGVPPNKAVVGANAFAHEAGIHQDGMLKDARTYQIIDPEEVGVRMTLPLGKHSGRHAFARACAERGYELEGAALNEAFRRFKSLADSGRGVALEDVFEGVPA